jgi:hypothetical protein
MNIKKLLGRVLKIPLLIVALATAGLGLYAASGAIPEFRIAYNAPIVLAIIIGLYVIGEILVYSGYKSETEITVEQAPYLDPNTGNYDEETANAIEQYEATN